MSAREPGRRGRPHVHALPRMVGDEILAVPYEGADIGDHALGAGLDQAVAERGGFHGACDDRKAGRVGGQHYRRL